MSAIVTTFENLLQFLEKRSQLLLLSVVLVIATWFVNSEWKGQNYRLTNVEVRLDKVGRGLDKLEADVAGLDKRITVLEIKVDALTAEVKEMKGDIKTILTILTAEKN
jgi:peptidoglycan hydrolase CwlO-like protein